MNSRKKPQTYGETFRNNAFGKEQWQYPPANEINAKELYAFTINPKIQESAIYGTYLDFQKLILCKLQESGIRFKLRTEFSKNRRLHYHGYIYFPNYAAIASFYYLYMPELKEHSSFAIVKIPNTEDDPYYNWYLYTIKDRHLVKPLLRKMHLPYKVTDNTKSLAKLKNPLDY